MEYKDEFVAVNGINLHYITYGDSSKQPVIFMHGLTANAHAFDGIVATGLLTDYFVVSVDLRGRGLSDHPAFCYTLNEHAEDITGLLDHLKIEKAVLCGHSFGGLLSFYLAANYADRVERMIILDAAAQMNPNAAEMLSAALLRLDKVFPSFKEYLDMVKNAPYNTFWDDAMLSYYQADVKEMTDGSVTPRSTLANIIEVAINVSNEPWMVYIEKVTQPVVLLNALDIYTLGEPLLPENLAREIVERMPNAEYHAVDGNHQTMMYGTGAKQIAKTIRDFVS